MGGIPPYRTPLREAYMGGIPLPYTSSGRHIWDYTLIHSPQGGIYGRFTPLIHPQGGTYGRFTLHNTPSGRHIWEVYTPLIPTQGGI